MNAEQKCSTTTSVGRYGQVRVKKIWPKNRSKVKAPEAKFKVNVDVIQATLWPWSRTKVKVKVTTIEKVFSYGSKKWLIKKSLTNLKLPKLGQCQSYSTTVTCQKYSWYRRCNVKQILITPQYNLRTKEIYNIFTWICHRILNFFF